MSIELDRLARAACAVARQAGDAILEVYRGEFAVERKDDNSPLTAADLAAHRIIVDKLHALTPDLPVLSEEAAETVGWEQRRQWSRYWLVDPLDGTREFVKRNGEFTVNIALIERHRPVLGVVLAPVLEEMFWGWDGGGAHLSRAARDSVRLHTRKRGSPLTIAGSRSHASAREAELLSRLGAIEKQPLGSSLKFCRIAAGLADLYLRLGPTSEWDTAAGHCVLEQAGGEVTGMDGNALRYNTRDSLLNPDFVAFGDPSLNWAQLLTGANATASDSAAVGRN